MAIIKKNNYSINDVNLTALMTTVDYSYVGKADITLSNYDNNSAPDVKVGSVFENNGAQFVVETSDETPTGYAGITNSTTFYLYYDSSAGAFIYSNTAPTWSNALQNWYNGNDRALFMMYKDSGGTLYANKQKLKYPRELYTTVLNIGDWDMDGNVQKTVTHYLELSKIRNIVATIRNDADTLRYVFPSVTTTAGTEVDGFVQFTNSTQITLARRNSGTFDDTDYDSTSYNRGWVKIEYEI
jgi:hypothetical protein